MITFSRSGQANRFVVVLEECVLAFFRLIVLCLDIKVLLLAALLASEMTWLTLLAVLLASDIADFAAELRRRFTCRRTVLVLFNRIRDVIA